MKYPTQEEILELSAEDRLRLIGDLTDTFAAHPETLPLSEEHARELDRALEAWEKNPEAGEPWPDVRRRIMKT